MLLGRRDGRSVGLQSDEKCAFRIFLLLSCAAVNVIRVLHEGLRSTADTCEWRFVVVCGSGRRSEKRKAASLGRTMCFPFYVRVTFFRTEERG